MRGDYKFQQYKETLFPVPKPEGEPEEGYVPGRSSDKIEERNEFIMYRKYYLQKTFEHIQWYLVRRHLAEELFLEEQTIQNIVMNNPVSDVIYRRILKEAPTVKQLKAKYWRVRWDLTLEEVMG